MFVKREYKKDDLQDNLKQLIAELRDFVYKTDTNTAIYANVANHLKNYFNLGVN